MEEPGWHLGAAGISQCLNRTASAICTSTGLASAPSETLVIWIGRALINTLHSSAFLSQAPLLRLVMVLGHLDEGGITFLSQAPYCVL